MKIITRILFTAAVAMLYISSSSCNKMPFVGTESFSDNEIRFGDAGLVVETKAFTETTNTTLQANGFNVAAIIDSDKSTMFNKAVTYSGGAFRVPGEKYYFPETGTMSFYAAYPKTQAITVTNGAATLSYSHNPDNDLIAAKATSIYEQSTDVMMAFDHILSQVRIKAQGKDGAVNYKVFSVKITDAKGGTYTYADGTWTPSSTAQAYTVYNNASGMTVSTSSMTAVGSAMSFMPGTAKLNVVWKCYNKGTAEVLSEKDATVDINLPQGKHTTLNLTLPSDLSNLTFDTSVGAWVDTSENIEMKYKPEMVSGVFTVNDSGKKVKFTKGNLYWNGSEFRCEDSQIAYPTTRNADHIGHFFYSKTASVAYAASYSDSGASTSDKFFAADGGAIEGFTVLSEDEWYYLISHSLEEDLSPKQVSVNGKFCIILKSDGFSGAVKDSYTASEWATAEAAGLVALPFAGNFYGSSIRDIDAIGCYRSSTPDFISPSSAIDAIFSESIVFTDSFNRSDGKSVRLVSVQ